MAKATDPNRPPKTPPGITPVWGKRRQTWRFRVRYRAPDGSPREEWCENITAAKQLQANRRTDTYRGDWIDPRKGRRLFEEWCDDYLATCAHLKPATRARYRSAIDNQVLPAFGAMPVGAIDQAAVRTFLSRLREDGAGRGTVGNARTVLSGVLGLAADGGAIRSNPARGARIGKVTHEEQVFLTAAQVEQLADEIEHAPIVKGGGEHRRKTFPDYALAVRVAAYTGLRAGELWALQIANVDLMRHRIHVIESLPTAGGVLEPGPTKNYERRDVPIPAHLIDPLRDHVGRRRRDAPVFTNRDGAYVRHNGWYRRYYAPAVTRAAMPGGTSFHSLRHTCAALLAAQGLTEVEVMKQLGHGQPVATYRHLFPDATDRAAVALDAAYAARATDQSDAQVVNLTRGKRGVKGPRA